MATPRPTRPRREPLLEVLLSPPTEDVEAILAENRRLRELVVQLSRLVVQNAIERR